jgi:hypothetical protein
MEDLLLQPYVLSSIFISLSNVFIVSISISPRRYGSSTNNRSARPNRRIRSQSSQTQALRNDTTYPSSHLFTAFYQTPRRRLRLLSPSSSSPRLRTTENPCSSSSKAILLFSRRIRNPSQRSRLYWHHCHFLCNIKYHIPSFTLHLPFPISHVWFPRQASHLTQESTPNLLPNQLLIAYL